jgi:hypothetical protein
VVSNQFGDERPRGSIALKVLHDAGVRGTPIGLEHRLISGALQQCMAEFETDLAIVMIRSHYFRVYQQFQRFNHLRDILLQQRRQEIRGKRPPNARRCLNHASSIGDAVKSLGYHCSQRQRQIAAPARRGGCLFFLIHQGQRQILDKERDSIRCFDGAPEFLIRKILCARHGACQFIALIFRQLAELNDQVRGRKVWTFWKGASCQRNQNGTFCQAGNDLLQQFGR